jgi:prepilin-type N-terminal cleavage/methylation domain-containing protein
MRRRSFTLLELMIVIIIIGILATLGLINYQLVVEKTHDDKAKSELKLIRAAERIYRMEQGAYIPCGNTAAVNTNLKLAISNPPTGATWSYTVAGSPTAFQARALRVNAPGRVRTWCISQDPDAEPCCSGATCSTSPGCPAGCP